MKEIIVLQHADCEGPGTIGDAARAANVNIRTLRGDLGQPIPSDPGMAAGLVVMGGPMGVYEHERYPFLNRELRLIEKAIRGGLPVLGICLGSQLMASALGSKVYKGSRKEIGWYPVFLEPEAEADPLFRAAGEQFDAFHWHGDVFDLPKGAVRLARSALTPCQAFRFNNACGILFHMEVTRLSICGMVEAFPEELAEAGASPTTILQDSEARLSRLQSIGEGAFREWISGLNSLR
jgi:GMP synthase (glutamine-hydrolysing)